MIVVMMTVMILIFTMMIALLLNSFSRVLLRLFQTGDKDDDSHKTSRKEVLFIFAK